MNAPLKTLKVGVVVERRKATSPWIDYIWRPVAALAGAPDVKPWTPIREDGEATQFYAGSADVSLFVSETGHYRDNVTSGSPSLWIVLSPTGVEPPFEIACVTADPHEGEGYTVGGDNIVDNVPMPEPVLDAVEDFVVLHHVERTFFKRKRNRADPEALARRPAGERDER